MTPRLYLHGGTQKTGAKAIQNFAVKNADALRGRGLVYAEYAPGVLPPSGRNAGHHELAKAVGGEEASTYSLDDVRSMVSRWRDQAAGEEADVLVSVERIYRLTQGAGDWSERRRNYLQSLADVLEGFDVRPILIFRRPDDYVHSWYHEIVRTRLAQQPSFEEFLQSDDAVGVEYSTQADLFSEVFGSVDCLTFEELVRGEGLVTNFFDHLGRDVRGMDEVGHVRGGLSAAEAAVKNHANGRLKRPQHRTFVDALERGVLDVDMSRQYGDQKYSLWASHGRRAEYLASRGEDLDRLGARHFGGCSGDEIFPPLVDGSTPSGLPPLNEDLAGRIDSFVKGLRFADRRRGGGGSAKSSGPAASGAKQPPNKDAEQARAQTTEHAPKPTRRHDERVSTVTNDSVRATADSLSDFGSEGDRRLVLHIGAHKTASSLVQATLRRDAAELRARGLDAVHRQPIMNSSFHEGVRELVQGKSRPHSPDDDRRSFAELVDGTQGNVLLTNEDFFETFNRPQFYQHIGPALEHVCDVVGTRDVRVVLYVRNQIDYVESLFMHHIHLGHQRDFDTFLAKYLDFDLSWKRVLDDIASVVGRENVVGIPYESIKRVGASDFYQTFLSVCGITDPTGLAISEDESLDRSANRSYSQDALEIASVVNPLLDKEGRNALRKFLQRKYSTATHPRAVLVPDGQRREIRERLRPDNERLFAEYLSDWDADRESYM